VSAVADGAGAAPPEAERGLRLTSTGLAVAAGSIVLGGAGWLLGLPELVVVAVAGAAALVLALLATAAPLAVDLDRRFRPGRVTVDAPAAGLLTVTSRSRLPLPGLTAVDQVGGRPLPVRIRPLAPRGSTVVRTLLPTDRRGRLALGPVRVERQDALGLATRWRALGGSDVLWVRPRVHVVDPLPTGVVLDLEGPISDTAVEGTLTFSTLREYAPGDDLRRIHWPTTARTGGLMVRTHVDTSQPRATVVLDARTDAWDPERFEQGVEVAASLVAAFGRTGSTVELQLVGEDRTAASRLGARDDLDRLALVGLTDIGITGLLANLERAEGGGALVVVTGATDREVLTRVAARRRRHAPIVVVRIVAGARPTASRHRGVLDVVAADARTALAGWDRELRR